ncbi:phenoloxidase-activating factor 3 [Drosophila montana]|uniref:phenoloxidase-activating factor 3 n=1 Tax=Drosophila montana TaxID=40370 RepID=UPI00313B545B
MQLFMGVLSLVLLAVPTLVSTQADNSCYTPIGEFGYCVPAQQCQFVRNLQSTYGRNIPRLIQNQLRQMACNIGQRSVFHLCCPSAAVITAQSGGNDNRNTFSARNPTTTEIPQSTGQATGDLKRIDSRGMELLNSVTECGKKANTKLSGGEIARLGEFPWLALLKYETSERPFLCGGSLIADRFVLTAAHCVTRNKKLIGVRLGEHNLGTEKDCEFLGGRVEHCLPPYEEFGLEDVRPHPNYNSINNDIALIKLDRPVQFKTHIKPICLPIDRKSQDISYDQSFFISGWGRTENNEPSSVLLKAVVKRQNHNVCRNFYDDAHVNQNHICAAGEGVVHTCPGDSGGPLFFRNSFKDTIRFVQYGIVSYGGRRCGQRQNQPGVFASVLDMLPWITQNLY